MAFVQSKLVHYQPAKASIVHCGKLSNQSRLVDPLGRMPRQSDMFVQIIDRKDFASSPPTHILTMNHKKANLTSLGNLQDTKS